MKPRHKEEDQKACNQPQWLVKVWDIVWGYFVRSLCSYPTKASLQSLNVLYFSMKQQKGYKQ